MGGWTEEASLSGAAGRSWGGADAAEAARVDGVPWLTLLLLAACAALLGVAGGFSGGLPLRRLLACGAKATSLIFDRGETWRLLAANLVHKDLLHLCCNA